MIKIRNDNCRKILLGILIIIIIMMLGFKVGMDTAIYTTDKMNEATTDETTTDETTTDEANNTCDKYIIKAYKGKFDINNYAIAYLNKYNFAKITVKLTQDFIDNDSYKDNYKFGLKIFVGNTTDNSGYYKVLRNKNNGLVPAYILRNGYTWIIPLREDIIMASDKYKTGKQYKVINLSDYFNEDPTKIGAYISSTEESEGWELANVEIQLCESVDF